MSFSRHKPCGDQNNKFGHQLLVTTIGDQNFSIIHFRLPQLMTKFFSIYPKNFKNCMKKLVVRSRVAIDPMTKKKLVTNLSD
jgi:hypothetical protein